MAISSVSGCSMNFLRLANPIPFTPITPYLVLSVFEQLAKAGMDATKLAPATIAAEFLQKSLLV
jgi:hypothetical protein